MEFTNPNSTGFTVYSKSGCIYCVAIKKILKEKNFLITEINCDEYILEDKERFLSYIESIIGHSHKTFPIVFYEEKFIGGLNETTKFIEKLVLSFEDIF
jgi:glutaredoxin